jgi:hypothetical protein
MSQLMKTPKSVQPLLILAALALWMPGCATRNVNPPQPRPGTGYVDFHTDAAPDLIWEVVRLDDRAKASRKVFTEFEPPQGGVLRLAFPPGHYRLRVMFLNRAVLEPGLVEVEVKDGMITPVRMELAEIGVTSVETKEASVGGTAYGRYGRRTKIGSAEAASYRLTGVAAPPVVYQPKERMPYAR